MFTQQAAVAGGRRHHTHATYARGCFHPEQLRAARSLLRTDAPAARQGNWWLAARTPFAARWQAAAGMESQSETSAFSSKRRLPLTYTGARTSDVVKAAGLACAPICLRYGRTPARRACGRKEHSLQWSTMKTSGVRAVARMA